MDITRAQIATIFEEWQRRYQANPSAFVSDDDSHGTEPRTYGDQAADTFLRIGTDIGVKVSA